VNTRIVPHETGILVALSFLSLSSELAALLPGGLYPILRPRESTDQAFLSDLDYNIYLCSRSFGCSTTYSSFSDGLDKPADEIPGSQNTSIPVIVIASQRFANFLTRPSLTP